MNRAKYNCGGGKLVTEKHFYDLLYGVLNSGRLVDCLLCPGGRQMEEQGKSQTGKSVNCYTRKYEHKK